MTELATLMPAPVDLTGYRLGPPQQAGALTVVPVWGPEHEGFVSPRTGLKLNRVVSYGTVELQNGAAEGVVIVPLHIGYIQHAAQNHALCSAALIAAGQTRQFETACCVQQTQGGLLQGRDQWFFVLPLELRREALELRDVRDFAKLWSAIARLNAAYGLPGRGHLEQILTRKRPILNQFRNRLEPLPGQVGALFFIGEAFAGMEIAPSSRYFADLWMPLVCFAYGVAAWQAEPEPAPALPYRAGNLAELRAELERDRAARMERVASWLAEPAVGGEWSVAEEERYLDLRLSTVTGDGIAGQVVTRDGRPVYASLFSTRWER